MTLAVVEYKPRATKDKLWKCREGVEGEEGSEQASW